MRRPPSLPRRPSADFRIAVITLDQQHIVGGLSAPIPPLLPRIVLDTARRPQTVRVDVRNGKNIFLVHGRRVCDGQRIRTDWPADRPPHVDDACADPLSRNLVDALLGQMQTHTVEAGLGRLVDVHAQHRAPARGGVAPADGVVENDNLLDPGDGCGYDGFGVGVVDASDLGFGGELGFGGRDVGDRDEALFVE